MILQRAFKILLSILGMWMLLTVFVEIAGPAQSIVLSDPSFNKKALVIYDPDPIYNLDEQVCTGFARGLNGQGFNVDIMTVKALRDRSLDQYNLYVFCANTYNWAPDWAIVNFIKRHHLIIAEKPAVAITLGSGSTSRAKRMLEDYLNGARVNLLESQTYWLLRPNDESRMDESNVAVAVDLATRYGSKIGTEFKSTFDLVN